MNSKNSFEQLAKGSNGVWIEELWALIRHTKKFWLAPILIVLLLLGILVFLSGTAAAPFIYTLF